MAAARLRKQEEVKELGGSLEEETATSSSPLRSIQVKRTQNAIYKHALSKPGKHLGMEDPRIIAVKEYVQGEVANGAVHPVLVGNFDQVWTTLYEPATRVVWKDPKQQGSTTLNPKP